MIRQAVKGAAATASTPGSAARRRPTIPKWPGYLVRLGIDSMSLNPDTVMKTTRRILELEQRLDAASGAAYC